MTSRSPVAKSAIVITLLAVAGAACSSSSSGGTSPSGSTTPKASAGGNSVTYVTSNDVDTFNPAKTSGTLGYQMAYLAYDRLLYLSPSGTLEPYLATSWKATPNSATLHIRKGVTCADGTPVTPTVVANSLRYLGKPSTSAPYGSQTFPTKNFTVTADDAAGTVSIHLGSPNSDLLLTLSQPPSSIICPAGLKNPSSMSTTTEGSGPYVLDNGATKRGTSYVLKARPGYNWGPDNWSTSQTDIASTITAQVVPEVSTQANLVLAGQATIAALFGVNEPRVAGDKSLFSTSVQDIGAWGLVMNQAPGLPGADPKVRQAVYLALSSAGIMEAYTQGQGKVYNTLVTSNMQCYDPSLGQYSPGYDPTQAKALLASAGYTPGAGGILTKDGKQLTLRIAMWNTTGQAGEYIQQELSKIGIKSTLQNQDVNTWVTTLFTKHQYDLTLYAYRGTLPSPNSFPSQDQDIKGIVDPGYYHLVNNALAASPANRCADWNAAMKKDVQDFNVKPVGVSVTHWFANGWKLSPIDNNIFDPFTLQKI